MGLRGSLASVKRLIVPIPWDNSWWSCHKALCCQTPCQIQCWRWRAWTHDVWQVKVTYARPVEVCSTAGQDKKGYSTHNQQQRLPPSNPQLFSARTSVSRLQRLPAHLPSKTCRCCLSFCGILLEHFDTCGTRHCQIWEHCVNWSLYNHVSTHYFCLCDSSLMSLQCFLTPKSGEEISCGGQFQQDQVCWFVAGEFKHWSQAPADNWTLPIFSKEIGGGRVSTVLEYDSTMLKLKTHLRLSFCILLEIWIVAMAILKMERPMASYPLQDHTLANSRAQLSFVKSICIVFLSSSSILEVCCVEILQWPFL